MKIITREEVSSINEGYKEVLDSEVHHNHELILDDHDVIRWKENAHVRKTLDKINLNDLWVLFHYMGLNKNSDSVRKLYRDMGYSLFGYWEIFYKTERKTHWSSANGM